MADERSAQEILGGLAIFADLTHPQLEALTHIFEEQWFNEGERILRRGFSGSSFYVILDGSASLQVDGKEFGRLGRGDFFGEISLLLSEPPVSDVVASGPLRCVSLGGPEFQEFLEANPKVMYRVLQAEATKLRRTVE